jgi:hypothetical protein
VYGRWALVCTARLHRASAPMYLMQDAETLSLDAQLE